MRPFRNISTTRARILVFAAFIAAILTACGQTGELYMPEPYLPAPPAKDTQKPQHAKIPAPENTTPDNDEPETDRN